MAAGVGKGNGSAARHHLNHCAHVHVGPVASLVPFHAPVAHAPWCWGRAAAAQGCWRRALMAVVEQMDSKTATPPLQQLRPKQCLQQQ